MNGLLVLITALVVSMAVIPVMIRLAPRIGMVDLPDPRKVHVRPVPRVGGVGIAVGAIVAVLLFAPLDTTTVLYLTGAALLVGFGAWDDACELGHYVKFVGQFLAVVPLVYWGDLWVAHVPFLAEPLPAWLGKPFTVFAIVGMINAINHSDGLDGLAGGESLMSLACLVCLAWLSDGTPVVLIATAVIGGVFGFLRFNTHPARIFMGDSGSQFIGFSLGVLAVMLTQRVNTALSMALPVLILGLPIVDILAVFVQRMRQKMNWFRATRNHIHHRLLDLGFDHYQAVMFIYAVQAFLVLSAIVLRYESDLLVAGLYLGICMLVFLSLTLAERSGWRANRSRRTSDTTALLLSVRDSELVRRWPLRFVVIAVPVYFLVVGLLAAGLPNDAGSGAWFLFGLLLLAVIGRDLPIGETCTRFALYATGAFFAYTAGAAVHEQESAFPAIASAMFFAALAAAAAVCARFSRSEEDFAPTTMDFLLVVLMVGAGAFLQTNGDSRWLGAVIVQMVILLYASELVVTRGGRRASGAVVVAGLAAVGTLMLRQTFLI